MFKEITPSNLRKKAPLGAKIPHLAPPLRGSLNKGAVEFGYSLLSQCQKDGS